MDSKVPNILFFLSSDRNLIAFTPICDWHSPLLIVSLISIGEIQLFKATATLYSYLKIEDGKLQFYPLSLDCLFQAPYQTHINNLELHQLLKAGSICEELVEPTLTLINKQLASQEDLKKLTLGNY
jgi:hypothetical protein